MKKHCGCCEMAVLCDVTDIAHSDKSIFEVMAFIRFYSKFNETCLIFIFEISLDPLEYIQNEKFSQAVNIFRQLNFVRVTDKTSARH